MPPAIWIRVKEQMETQEKTPKKCKRLAEPTYLSGPPNVFILGVTIKNPREKTCQPIGIEESRSAYCPSCL
jgi:hypothetical protein